MKVCKTCDVIKPLDNFYKAKAMKDGLKNQCKSCINTYNAQYRKNNANAIKEKDKEWQLNNNGRYNESRKVSRLKYYNSNRTKILDTMKEYRNSNKGAVNHHTALRRARKLSATVPWADLEAINRMYMVSQFITEKLGDPHHVDHIVPLQGDRVCGLHIESNMQIIPACDNLSKSNKFTEYTND